MFCVHQNVQVVADEAVSGETLLSLTQVRLNPSHLPLKRFYLCKVYPMLADVCSALSFVPFETHIWYAHTGSV